MSLIHCPECAHEVATSASACPNCGRPLAPPVAERKVVVVDPPQSESFPTWALIPIGLLGVILIAVLFLLFNRSSEDANANIRVNANFSGSRPVARTEVPSTTTEVPSTSSAPVSMPPASQTTVPGSQATVNQPTKGKVTIAAKVVTANGKTQNVSNALLPARSGCRNDPQRCTRRAYRRPDAVGQPRTFDHLSGPLRRF